MDLNYISTKLMYSTIILKAKNKDNEYDTGTAFFFNFKLKENNYFTAIITNRHIVSGSTEITAVLHESTIDETGKKTPENKGFLVKLPSWGDEWICHPDNDIDLCGLVVNQGWDTIKRTFYIGIPEDLLNDDQNLSKLQAVEDVLMVGYPLGRYDSKHSLPIFRKE